MSSAFVIPLIKQLHVKGETYSILTLESAITDVLCIVFALTMIEIINLNAFSFQTMLIKIISLFAIAGFIGIIAGIIWIFLVVHVFKEHKSYMITIAYLILVYVLTEFLHGNGAIAALFFGLMLRNSRQLTSIFDGVINKYKFDKDDKTKSDNMQKSVNGDYGVTVTSSIEEIFYSQISFFLKTFFFVYIGILFNLHETKAILIGIVISLLIMLTRISSNLVTKKFDEFDRKLIQSIFARGLAAAAIVQIVLLNNIENAVFISNIVYSVISFTIVLSSIRIFLIERHIKLNENK
ncbi:MAG: cation:proton antiporter [archaeon]